MNSFLNSELALKLTDNYNKKNKWLVKVGWKVLYKMSQRAVDTWVSSTRYFNFSHFATVHKQDIERPKFRDSIKPDIQMATAQTAKTQYVEANGIRFAYRKFGKKTESSLPLFLHGHFRSNM